MQNRKTSLLAAIFFRTGNANEDLSAFAVGAFSPEPLETGVVSVTET